MIIPIWMEDWEHECCGPEVKIGDRVAWRVYAYVDDSLKTTAEECHILAVSDDEVEIVGDWAPQTVHSSAAFGALSRAPLHVGVTIRTGQQPRGSPVKYRGKIWNELHSEVQMDAVPGVVRGIYHHPAKLARVAEIGWKVVGFERGRPIPSNIEAGIGGSWAFRFLVEIDV